MKVFVCLNDDGFPDSWSTTELPNAVSFDQSELPENYGVEFAERKWQVIDGELVPAEEPIVPAEEPIVPVEEPTE